MSRPVTLFTGQWADLPFVEICEKAAAFGYDGLELACWGDHFEVQKALSEEGYSLINGSLGLMVNCSSAASVLMAPLKSANTSTTSSVLVPLNSFSSKLMLLSVFLRFGLIRKFSKLPIV